MPQHEVSALLPAHVREELLQHETTQEGWRVIPWCVLRDYANHSGIPLNTLEIALLEAGIAPARYLRNLGVFGIQGQAALAKASVFVAGCGGLGSIASEMLARAGVGHLTLVDGDTYSESNLNRQSACTEHTLGQKKALVLANRISAINSATTVTTHACMFNEQNISSLLTGCNAVFDGLDNIKSRFIMLDAAAKLHIPVMHGAIENMQGQVACIAPEDEGIREIMRAMGSHEIPPATFSNPVTTATAISAMQVAQILLLLTGKSTNLAGCLFQFDMQHMTTERCCLPDCRPFEKL